MVQLQSGVDILGGIARTGLEKIIVRLNVRGEIYHFTRF
jgi:hypothetical protein